MLYVSAIVVLALIQFLYFGAMVGQARGRHEVSAPAVTGDEQFERFFRAHQNTMEQLVVFIPAIFIAGVYTHQIFAVGCGVLFLIARALYFRQYITEPASRGSGMIATLVAQTLLVLGSLLGVVREMLF